MWEQRSETMTANTSRVRLALGASLIESGGMMARGILRFPTSQHTIVCTSYNYQRWRIGRHGCMQCWRVLVSFRKLVDGFRGFEGAEGDT